MSAAPSWPLVSSLPGERTFRTTVATVTRVEFRSISRPEAHFQEGQVLNLFFRPSKRKTTRGALSAPARPNHVIADCKSPKLPVSRRPDGKKRRLSYHQPCIRAGNPIWVDNIGESRGKPPIPHTFSCTTCNEPVSCTPFAWSTPVSAFAGRNRLSPAGWPGFGSAIHVSRREIPDLARSPGISPNQPAVT